MADYSSNTICDLPKVKRRDWPEMNIVTYTTREEYIFEFKSRKLCMAVSFTLADLKFLVQQSFSINTVAAKTHARKGKQNLWLVSPL